MYNIYVMTKHIQLYISLLSNTYIKNESRYLRFKVIIYSVSKGFDYGKNIRNNEEYRFLFLEDSQD